MKKRLLSALIALALVVTLVGCTNQQTTPDAGATTPGAQEEPQKDPAQTPSTGEVQTVKYWYRFGGESETWDKWRQEEFEKNNPGYKIEATYVPPDCGVTDGKLLAAIAAKDVPDVINVANTLSYPLATQGAFEDLTDYMAKLGRTREDYVDSVQSLIDIKGGWYLLPMETDTTLLYINNKLAEKAGLDPSKPPKTMSEVDDWAEKLTVMDGENIQTMGFIPWIDGGDDTYVYAWAFGAQLYDPESNTLDLASDAFVKAFQWETKYAQKYAPERIKSFTSAFGGAFSPDHAFFTEKVAMTINGNWFQQAIKQYAPDMDVSIVPMPVSDDQEERYGACPLAVVTFACPKGAKNIEGACRFVDFVGAAYINDDSAKTWYTAPTRKDAYEGLTLVEEKDPLYETIQSLVSNSYSETPVLTSIRSIMYDEIQSVRDQVIYDNADPKALLEALQPNMETELAKAG